MKLKAKPEAAKTLDRSKLGKRSKSKGDSYERNLAKEFKKVYGEDFVRTPQSGGFSKSKEAVNFRGDIVPLDENVDLLLHIEAKNHKQLALHQWIEQSMSDCPAGKVPIVIFHQHGTSKDYVVIQHTELLKLLDTKVFYHKNFFSEKWYTLTWYEQAVAECPSHLIPVVVCPHRGIKYVMIHLPDFFRTVPKESIFVRRS